MKFWEKVNKQGRVDKTRPSDYHGGTLWQFLVEKELATTASLIESKLKRRIAKQEQDNAVVPRHNDTVLVRWVSSEFIRQVLRCDLSCSVFYTPTLSG